MQRVTFWIVRHLGLCLVLVPTLLAALIVFGCFSDQYVSEVQFVVRAPTPPSALHAPRPDDLGSLSDPTLQPDIMTLPHVVQTWLTSPEALGALSALVSFGAQLQSPQVDWLHRYPAPWEAETVSALYRHFRQLVFVSVAEDSRIVTLDVTGFAPDTAARNAHSLWVAAEDFVNRLNARAALEASQRADVQRGQAQARLQTAEAALTAFRQQVGSTDVAADVGLQAAHLTQLRLAASQSQSTAAHLPTLAPDAPRRLALDERAEALAAVAQGQQDALTRGPQGSAVQLEAYQRLVLDVQLATAAYVQADNLAQRLTDETAIQHVYLERVSGPSVPDEPRGPKRWQMVALVAAVALALVVCARSLIARVMDHATAEQSP